MTLANELCLISLLSSCPFQNPLYCPTIYLKPTRPMNSDTQTGFIWILYVFFAQNLLWLLTDQVMCTWVMQVHKIIMSGPTSRAIRPFEYNLSLLFYIALLIITMLSPSPAHFLLNILPFALCLCLNEEVHNNYYSKGFKVGRNDLEGKSGD